MLLLHGAVLRLQTLSIKRQFPTISACSRSYVTLSLKSSLSCLKKTVLEPWRTPIQIQIRSQFDFSKKEKTLTKGGNWFKKPKLEKTSKERNQTTLLYLISLAVLTAGASYAAVPLYR
jgi:hypothetical protein